MQYCERGTLGDALDRGWLRTSPAPGAGPDMAAVLATAQASSSVPLLASLARLYAQQPRSPQRVVSTAKTSQPQPGPPPHCTAAGGGCSYGLPPLPLGAPR